MDIRVFRIAFTAVLCAAGAAAAQTPHVTRDAQRSPTIHAIELTAPLKIDGKLDEAIYGEYAPLSDFVQMEPTPGAPATEKTEVWLAFDRNKLYLTVRAWTDAPESKWVLDEMRRDSPNIPKNENVAFFFDTFHDRRNAFVFEITPLGAIWDAQGAHLRPGSADWNPVWESKTGRFEGGWTAEMAFPFKSLRYKPGTDQTWGFNMRRTSRWKNEESYPVLLPLISGFSGAAAIFQIANGIPVTGLKVPAGSKNLELKPYVVSSVTTDRVAQPQRTNDGEGDFGIDVKYGLTQNLTADFTYNTDFAQVEVDTQQVNLTRFSLFFPEKREFFLEGQSIFDFGGVGGLSVGGAAPMLFFSRRIGLNAGRSVPIQGGGRLTGRAGKFIIGLLDVRTDDDGLVGTPATNFSVVRVKRDILNRSSIGALFTGRSVSALNPTLAGSSMTYGLDAALNIRNYVTVNSYYAKTDTPGLIGGDTSYRLQASYNLDRYGLEFERLAVGDNFNPEVGFLQRDDFHRTRGVARFSPRPKNARLIRKYTYQASADYFTDGANRLQSLDADASVAIDFQNSDRVSVSYTENAEQLARPFAISRGVVLPVGRYDFRNASASVSFGNQHWMSGALSFDRGSFYSGDKTTVGFSSARIMFSPKFSLEPTASFNVVDLEQGSFTSTVLSNRVTYTMTPRMFLSGLLQYGSANRSVGSNVRFRWEYQPGSELFVVYTDELDTAVPNYPDLKNRAFVVKINRLFRF
jgi:hypothetical protein